MDQTVSCFRLAIGQDASGARTATYPPTPALTGVVASIQSASSRDMDVWDRRNIVFDYWIYSTANFDALLTGGLKLTDKFVDANGINYLVQGYCKQFNAMISDTPLYEIQCQRVIS